MNYPLAITTPRNTSMQLNDIHFILEELKYYPTRSHQPMLLRPYVFNDDSEAVSRVAERMSEQRLGRITPGMLNGLASSIVQPSVVGYEGTVNHEWVSTDRFLFMFKVRYQNHMGAEINTYLFGYTEFTGITPSGHIDMNMVHYVNNVMETTVMHIPTPLGTRRVEKLHNLYNAIYSTNNMDVYTQRPVDLYNTIASAEMANFMSPDLQVQTASNLVTPFSNNVVTSTTENGIATEYLSKILTSGVQAIKSREIHINSYQIGHDDPAERFFTEPGISENLFLRTLSRMTGSRDTRPSFNFNGLMMMDKTIYERFELLNFTTDFASPIMTRTPEVGEAWGGQDPVTVKAFSLMENCVSMATKYGFTKMSFTCTNMGDPTMAMTFAVLDFNSFLSLSQQDFNYLLGIFEEKFKMEIFLNETAMGRIPMFMECHINLIGTSKIYLEYAGQPGTWFTVPTFASSLFSSVVSTDQGMVDHSAQQLGKTLNSLIEAHEPVYY